MSDGRKRLSGAKYRQEAKEKLVKQRKVIEQSTKIQSYFNTCSSSGASGKNVSDLNLIENVPSLSTENTVIVPVSSTENTIISPALSPQNIISNCSLNKTIDVTEIATNIENTNISTMISISNDPAKWNIDGSLIDFVVKFGFKSNKNVDFSTSKKLFGDKYRCFNVQNFSKKLKNGETHERDYLSYSESDKSIYCIPCYLFKDNSSFSKKGGCSDWKNISQLLESHENSSTHRRCAMIMIERSNLSGSVETFLLKNFKNEVDYWKNVLNRVVFVIKKLCSRGLPLRGHSEKFYDNHNGNFMMSLEMIAEYDSFLKEHILKYGNCGSGKTSYMSKTICDEFINIIGTEVRNKIISDIKKAKYFSIIVDSTPDISHTDQLSLIIRYVDIDNGKTVERFLYFFDNVGHKADEMFEVILKFLDKYKLNLADCRGQSYDNANNMSGIYNGLNAKILGINSRAIFVPCACHSINLVGQCAAECCTEAVHFFILIQKIYSFFSVSTKRWALLKAKLGPTKKLPKAFSDTRWSARSDACTALFQNYKEIIDVLKEIESDNLEKVLTRTEAGGLLRKMEKMEMALLLTIWQTILERFDSVNKKLQASNTNLLTVVQLYDSLLNYLLEMKNNFFRFQEKALTISVSSSYEQKRNRKRKMHFDESEEDEFITDSPNELFKKNVFDKIISVLIKELQKRKNSYNFLNEKFGYLENTCYIDTDVIIKKNFCTNFMKGI